MIVVTGATGNVGRPLVEALVAAGEQVTAVSRRPAELAGVRHVQADLGDPDRLRTVFAGADTLFLLVAGDNVVDVAKSSGIRRIVLLSSQGARTRPDFLSHDPMREAEVAVQQSGLQWTILRPGGFDSNAFAWAESVRSERTIAAPFADVGLPFIDPADIAEVAAAVLRNENHDGRTYELTGPALTTARERAAAIGDALGEPVRFVEQSREDARTQMVTFMPEPIVDGTLSILSEPTLEEQRISPDVQTILRRAPRPFSDWAVRNIAAFK
jgi:uncharacterized protein YbjT (DUF2867 family)